MNRPQNAPNHKSQKSGAWKQSAAASSSATFFSALAAAWRKGRSPEPKAGDEEWQKARRESLWIIYLMTGMRHNIPYGWYRRESTLWSVLQIIYLMVGITDHLPYGRYYRSSTLWSVLQIIYLMVGITDHLPYGRYYRSSTLWSVL